MVYKQLPCGTLSVLVLGVSLYLAPFTSAADFRYGSQTLTVPDGFTVELIAGPPLVNRPIVADFDEEGHLYVAESSGSNDPVKVQLEERPHSILRLTDEDGDGLFDSRTVFADKMMFPEGSLWYRGSLYVSAPPHIWKLTDRDGDGIAEEREIWYDAKTLTGCANDLHGPYLGRDGWIYWCKGAFAEQTLEREHGEPYVTRASHIYRRRPEGGEVEPVLIGGMDNPVDVVFSRTGERFLSCTFFQHPGGGKRDGLIHAIYGGVYGKNHGVLDGHPRTGGLMPVLDHLGPAAPCGLELYESEVFGTEFTGNLFATLFNLHQVTRHELVPEGASFRSQTSVFLESDDLDFHPTDVFEDADGSLIVVDTGGWYKLCCPTSQMHKPDVLGAIYRIRKTGASTFEDPRGGGINWTDAETSTLMELLGDARPYVVDRAIETLAQKGNAVVPDLSKALGSRRIPVPVKQNVVWTLTRIESSEARKVVRQALASEDADLLQTALHSVAVWRDEDALQACITLLNHPSLAVRRVAAEALGRMGNSRAVQPLLAALAAPEVRDDRILRHSLNYALIEIGDFEATVEGLAESNPRVLEAVLRTLQSLDKPIPPDQAPYVTRLLRHADSSLRQVAWAVAATQPAWLEEVLAISKTIVANFLPDSAMVADCRNGLSGMVNQAPVARFISESLQDEFFRPFAVELIRTADADKPPADWIQFVNASLHAGDSAVVSDALHTVKIWTANPDENGVGVDAFKDALLEVAQSQSNDAKVRVSALSLLSLDKGLEFTGDLYQLVLDSLQPSVDPLVRNQALGILTSVHLESSLLLQLARSLREIGPMELGRVLELFNQDTDTSVGSALVDALTASDAVVAIDRRYITTALEGYPDSIRERAETTVLPRLNRGGEAAAAELEALMLSLPGDGDVRRGQRVFQSSKAACSTCHAIGYVGGDLGPELSSIGKIRSKRDLLEAIVHPSVSFVRSYEPVILTKTDGTVLAGIIKDEGSEAIELAVGPAASLTISRNEVTHIEPSSVSLMPPGMNFVLSKQELADLLAFLQSRRGNWE